MTGTLGITLVPAGPMLSARIVPPASAPVEAMMLGRPPEAVAELMPRLFNLCGMAQALAVRLALGLPTEGIDPRAEILRDHLAKLCLHWPRLLGQDVRPLPQDWAAGGPRLQDWLWGGPQPQDPCAWLASGRGVAPVLAAIRDAFGPGEAVACPPALSDPAERCAQENSPAGRVADDPLMRQAEDAFGRGPLWRALGRAVDLSRMATGPVIPVLRADGTALVPAARGTYAVRAAAEHGIVTSFHRVTPTDHLIAAGGALHRSLSALPVRKAYLSPLVVDILDPCMPVVMREVADA